MSNDNRRGKPYDLRFLIPGDLAPEPPFSDGFADGGVPFMDRFDDRASMPDPNFFDTKHVDGAFIDRFGDDSPGTNPPFDDQPAPPPFNDFSDHFPDHTNHQNDHFPHQNSFTNQLAPLTPIGLPGGGPGGGDPGAPDWRRVRRLEASVDELRRRVWELEKATRRPNRG